MGGGPGTSQWTAGSLCLVAVLLLLSGASACTKSYAAAPRPDLSGTWDVVYDDFLDVELRIGRNLHHARLPRDGGRFVTSDSNGRVEFDIDCRRDEIVCPNEVWPTELTLTNRVGDFDDTGASLAISFVGEGSGACTLKEDSVLRASVESLGSVREGRWRATALSDGHVTTVVTGACLGVADSEGGKVEVALSSGMSAVLR